MVKDNTRLIFPKEPYRGIESFRFMDQNIFFGRDNEVDELMQLITIYKGVCLFGVQGIGKSSIISAGVIPKALKKNFIPDRIRVQPVEGAEFVIEAIYEEEADGDQVSFLPSNFIPFSDRNKRRTVSVDEFRKILITRNDTWTEYVRSSNYALLDDDCYRPITPLLIFDQFEEVVTLFEHGTVDILRKEKLIIQNKIFNELASLLYDDSISVAILFAFREDYQPSLEKFFNKTPDLRNQSLRLEIFSDTIVEKSFDASNIDNVVNRGFISEVVAGPVTNENRPPNYLNRNFENQLGLIVKYFENKIYNNSNSSAVLSEIQIVCQSVWRSGDEAIVTLKGCDRILSDFFKNRILKISKENIEIAEEILILLILNDARNIVSKSTLFDDLKTKFPETTEVVFERVLHELKSENVRLIREDTTRDIVCYDIINEFLIPSIKEKKDERTKKQIEMEAQKVLFETNIRIKQRRFLIIGVFIVLIFVLASLYQSYNIASNSLESQKLTNVELRKANVALIQQKAISDSVILKFRQEESRRKGLEVDKQLAKAKYLFDANEFIEANKILIEVMNIDSSPETKSKINLFKK